MRIKVFLVTLLLLTFSVALLYAQSSAGIPCHLADPDSNCPLDTWVIVLAGIAFLFAIIRLHRKNLAQSTGARKN